MDVDRWRELGVCDPYDVGAALPASSLEGIPDPIAAFRVI